MITASRESPDLPAGWAQATLGDIVDVVKQQVDPRDRPNEWYNYLSIENVEPNTGDLVNFRPTRGSDIRSTKLAFTTEDVLYSKLRPYLNKVHMPVFDGISATDLVPLRPRNPIPREFVAYLLRRRQTVEYANQRMRGIELPRVPLEAFLSMPILLPPLDEQTRILTKVGRLSLKMKTARRALERVPDLTRQLRRSMISVAFHGELTERLPNDEVAEILLERINQRFKGRKLAISSEGGGECRRPEATDALGDLPAGWSRASIGQVTDVMQYGYTQRASEKPIGPRLLRISDIQSGRVEWKKVPFCTIDTKEEEKYLLRDGDIVFARSGATVGKSFLVKKPPRAVFASYLIRIRLFPEVVPEYLFLYLNSEEYWSQIRPRGIAQPNVNSRALGNICFPLAPLHEQQKIVSRAEEVLTIIDNMHMAASDAQDKSSSLEQSILGKAFRGELIPQSPGDEPASALLARIKEQQ